jgi:ATP-dependent phosphoenolpyruvate carboxykinase
LHDKANIDYDHVDIQHNPSVASLYEDALVYESGSAITSAGALATSSGNKTGRSPQGRPLLKIVLTDRQTRCRRTIIHQRYLVGSREQTHARKDLEDQP